MSLLTSFIYNSGSLSDVFQILIFMFPLGLLFIRIVIKVFVIKKDKKLYDQIYKESILLNCLKEIFDNVEYKASEDDTSTDLLPEKFVEVVEDIKISGGNIFNDYISANYKNVNFEFADIEIIKDVGTHNGSSNDRSYTTFKGQWLVIETNRKIETNIQIFDKNFKGNTKNGLLRGKKYIETKTNNDEFNNQFKVFIENKIDISNILTANTLNKIKNIRNDLKLKMFLYFTNNRLYVLLENKNDLFESNIYRKMDLNQEKNLILNQAKNIIEFIEILNLD